MVCGDIHAAKGANVTDVVPAWLKPNSLPDDVSAALHGQLVFVTGANGFLGRHVCASLHSIGARLLTPSSRELDLTHQERVEQFIATHRPQHVVHLAAACGGIGANVDNPGRFLYENALMGLMLLDACRRHDVTKFALISTTCAYPKHARLPLTEDQLWDGKPVGATGPYGVAKRLLHEAIESYHTQYGFDGIVLVPANLYGPGDHFQPDRSHVVPAMIRRYVEAREQGQAFVLNWGTGKPTREFLFVRDAAEAIVLALARHHDPTPVNIGTGVETSIKSLASDIAELSQYSGELQWDSSKPDGQPRRYLDVTRSKSFGFTAGTALKDGLRETIEWFEHHPSR